MRGVDSIYYLLVWEVVVPGVKSSLLVRCSHQKRMEVCLHNKTKTVNSAYQCSVVACDFVCWGHC